MLGNKVFKFTNYSFGFHPTLELVPWLGGDVHVRERVLTLRCNDSFLAAVVCSPGGASKSDDYDDYEYYSSADIFLPPECCQFLPRSQ